MTDQKFQYPYSEAMRKYAGTHPLPTLRIGTICARLGFTVTADFLLQLGFAPAANDRAAKLYHERDFPSICAALSRRVSSAMRACHPADNAGTDPAPAALAIPTWRERQTKVTVMDCTMNCYPKTQPCDDCLPRDAYEPNGLVARDLEIAELREKEQQLVAALKIAKANLDYTLDGDKFRDVSAAIDSALAAVGAA